MTLIELTHQVGIDPKWVSYTGGGEYHSSCPACGGSDRFYIQPNRQMSKCLGYYRCRKCGISGDSIQFAKEFLKYSFQEAAEVVNAIITSESAFRPSFEKATEIELKEPTALWIEQATKFVNRSHDNILNRNQTLDYLEKRGLPLEAVIRYKLGWSDTNEFLSRSSWGLQEEMGKNSKPRKLWLPRGLVIPVIGLDKQVARIKIRRFDWSPGDNLPKYVAVSGSMNGLSIVGNTQQPVMIVVESELDAYAIDYKAHWLVWVVAVGSNIKTPDCLTNSFAKRAKHMLICYDNDDAGKMMLDKWRRLYPRAKSYPTPVGKDVGEALQKGFNIREWLLHATLNQ